MENIKDIIRWAENEKAQAILACEMFDKYQDWINARPHRSVVRVLSKVIEKLQHAIDIENTQSVVCPKEKGVHNYSVLHYGKCKYCDSSIFLN